MSPRDTAPPRITWPLLCMAIRDRTISDDDLGAMLRLWDEQGEVSE